MVGHTKNSADMLFNVLISIYWKNNSHSKEEWKNLSHSKRVTVHKTNEEEFFNMMIIWRSF